MYLIGGLLMIYPGAVSDIVGILLVGAVTIFQIIMKSHDDAKVSA